MDDAGDIAAQRQEDIQPKLQADADLQEDANGRQKNGKKNTDDVQNGLQGVQQTRRRNADSAEKFKCWEKI